MCFTVDENRFSLLALVFVQQLCSHGGWLLLKWSTIGLDFNRGETNCRTAHILGILLGLVVQSLDNSIQWINRYPVDKMTPFVVLIG